MKRKIYKPSKRSNVSPFYVMDLLQKAKDLETQKKVFHLELGEPQPKTPKKVLNKAKELLFLKIPGYTPSNGIIQLRNKISEFYKFKHRVNISPDRVFVTTGSSGAFLLSFLLNFDKGDRVAIFNPVYPAYRNILKSLDIEVVEIYPENTNGIIDLTSIKKKKNINGVIVSNPNNPNGQVFNKKDLKYIYDYCVTNRLRLIFDEIYHGITYNCKATTGLNFGDEAIIVNSFSKYFCMPGWRLGWLVVPDPLIENLLKLSQNIFISSGNIAQFSAIEVFDCLDHLDKIVDDYKKNREIAIGTLKEMPLLQYAIPKGAFYFYINIEKLGVDSSKLIGQILSKTGVALTPGIDFDRNSGSKTLRLSFSADTNTFRSGLKILKKWYQENY